MRYRSVVINIKMRGKIPLYSVLVHRNRVIMYRFISAIILVLSVLGVGSISDERLKLDSFNIYRQVARTTREVQQEPVTPENVTYYLFTKTSPNQYIQLKESNLDLLNNKKIVFLIHGWKSSREVEWYEDLKDAFLTSFDDYNVVQVDWKGPADQDYDVSSINTNDVARFIANLIVDLNRNHSVSLDDILVIGHSLGGQITGFVGKHVHKQTARKLPRIIALDPAGLLFDERPDDERLNKDDAEVVVVIHSNGGTFGFENATGTIDFFPNGGSSQPGCDTIVSFNLSGLVNLISCDHSRAVEYLIEAILNPNEFKAKKCANWDLFKDDKCENEEVPLGNLATKSTGKFYLETNKEKPFAKNRTEEEGLISRISRLLG